MAHPPALEAHAAHPAHIDTSTGLDSRKMAFWVFIGSECLLFGALIASYLAYKGKSLTGPYPHEGGWVNAKTGEVMQSGILDIPLTSASTFVLLMSSVFMVIALHHVQHGNRAQGRNWLLAVAAGGAGFLSFQVYEFIHFWQMGLTLSSNLFGSTFYLLTGFHGAHVFVGIIYMLTLATMVHRGMIPPAKSITVENGGLYWHFVDVIWLVIFPLVYLIR
jgi:cytochrome c oxidase subunit III